MKALFTYLGDRVLVLVRSIGPYAAIELLLPGGSVLALLYWWHRHRVRQARVVSKYDTSVDVPSFSEPLASPTPEGIFDKARPLANKRAALSPSVAGCTPTATPISSCRSLAA